MVGWKELIFEKSNSQEDNEWTRKEKRSEVKSGRKTSEPRRIRNVLFGIF